MNKLLHDALVYMRDGDLKLASQVAQQALRQEPDNVLILSTLGMIFGRAGELEQSVSAFQRALALAPDDIAIRTNLALGLVSVGRFGDAIDVSAKNAVHPRLRRVLAYARQMTGDLTGAHRDYMAVLADDPNDFESWNNLGNILTATADMAGAIEALFAANRLRPDVVRIHLNLARVLVATERTADARDTLRHAILIEPANPEILTELGLVEAALENFTAAERYFREAINASDGFTGAYIELGLLLESRNRIDDLEALIEEGARRGVAQADMALIRAWLLRRRGKLDEALVEARAIGADIDPLRRHQILADLLDRRGHHAEAFIEYSAMNAAALAAAPPPPAGPSYCEEIKAESENISASVIGSWPTEDYKETAPIFIGGFPRSGTTLLDTLLMNDDRFYVLEELPVMHAVGEIAPSMARLADANPLVLRASYFGALASLAPGSMDRIVVDKFPLHTARLPLIHRTFPNAAIVIVERHPCDVVLSCFMANFRLNRAMRHMTSIIETARLYDTVFTAFKRAEELLPLRIHRIRYERMVSNLENEMRELFIFLELPWNPAVLDNQSSASRREHIKTASYSQVTEPIYQRAINRWERYRSALAPALPILARWCDDMRYEWRS